MRGLNDNKEGHLGGRIIWRCNATRNKTPDYISTLLLAYFHLTNSPPITPPTLRFIGIYGPRVLIEPRPQVLSRNREKGA